MYFLADGNFYHYKMSPLVHLMLFFALELPHDDFTGPVFFLRLLPRIYTLSLLSNAVPFSSGTFPENNTEAELFLFLLLFVVLFFCI